MEGLRPANGKTVHFSGHILHLFGVYPVYEEYAKSLPVGVRACVNGVGRGPEKNRFLAAARQVLRECHHNR